jgi:hypothetical protein
MSADLNRYQLNLCFPGSINFHTVIIARKGSKINP